MNEKDILFMKRALQLAHLGNPSPNPCVGAVLVKNGKIISEGYNTTYGGPHGEVIALHNAEKFGPIADGATLYVTLEPCAHFGKTPPCIDTIIFNGVTRVVIGCVDKNPLVAGSGVHALLQAGIQVNVGILGKQCEAFYSSFFHYMEKQRPLVTLKSAMTLDGKIAKRNDQQIWITGKEAKKIAHQLRALHDAILVGVGTVLADDPQLTCRLPNITKQPTRIILDSYLRIPTDAHVLIDNNVILAITEHYDTKKFAILRARGVKFIVTKGKRVSVSAVMKQLPSFGILSVLVEGGAHVNMSFLSKNLVDKVCFFIAPKLFGEGVDAISGDVGGLDLKNVQYRQVGKDVYVEGTI
jgi:diaminohydroxyphosphoribosylaminopyrimidine deaminase / 5-amino-6-(5-phosphoribosylamino)uracil reductase